MRLQNYSISIPRQYSKMSKQLDPQVLQLYEVKKLLGSGAYGHVWKVIDRSSQKQLALKKIFDAFHNDVDSQRTYRQITVLHELKHPNIIKLHRVLRAKNNKDLYLVFDFMQADLQSLVGQEILEEAHISYVIYQILRALKYIHSAQLIHRDLKPSNILINSECQIKVCDFGLVRSLTHEQDQPMVLSQEVATRWYRSPEMLLGSKSYGKATDVWSLGCIIAEILMGEPLFPGESTLNQLERIVEFTGIPSKKDIYSLDSPNAQILISQLKTSKRPLNSYFKKQNKTLVNLVQKMLKFNPADRITIEQALELALFQEFASHKQSEDICTKFLVPQIDDNIRMSISEYRKMIYCDIDRRYPSFHMERPVLALNRTLDKENSISIRRQNSLQRHNPAQQLRKPNTSLHQHASHNQPASPCARDGADQIKKMKSEWNKEPECPRSPPPGFKYSQHKASSPELKPPSFHKNTLLAYKKMPVVGALAKVRSRKLLQHSKSKPRLLRCQENGPDRLPVR